MIKLADLKTRVTGDSQNVMDERRNRLGRDHIRPIPHDKESALACAANPGRSPSCL